MTAVANTIPSRARTRRRGLDTEATVPQPTQRDPVTEKMHEQARKFYLQNLAANKAGGEAKKARKELYAEMKDKIVLSFRTSATMPDGTNVPLDVSLGSPQRQVVDTDKLFRLVDLETFKKIVSATQDAVKEYAGSNVLNQCLVTVTGNEDAQVKPVK